jgi:hypothetical protein
MKTKSASDVLNQLNKMCPTSAPCWTSTQVANIFQDSDIAIFINKPNPWDGKGGVY